MTRQMTYAFMAFVFFVGVGLVCAQIYAGFSSWPFLLTIAVGAIAQTAFRTIKRMWRNALLGDAKASDGREVSDIQGLKYLLLIYVAMLAVSAFWYGIGWATFRLSEFGR